MIDHTNNKPFHFSHPFDLNSALEKCPEHISELDHDRKATSSVSSVDKASKPKRVAFSEYSSICIYSFDSKYESNKSYSSFERKAFQYNAKLDSELVRRLIASHPTQDSQTLNYLLHLGILDIEDLLGIEHLINEKGRARVAKQRRNHTGLLLKRQEEMNKRNIQDEEILASAVLSSSNKSLEKARLRALLAI